MAAIDTSKPLVELREIRKAFGGVKAVDGVSVNLYPGEVVALLGHNGAGKSTLMKMLAGAYPIDSGDTLIAGEKVNIRTPAEAQAQGIETTGVPAGVTQGLEMIRKLGRFVEFSVFGSETSADWSIIGDRKELDVRGAHLGPYCYPVAIDLLARGLVTSKGIVTHDFPLTEWERAFALANSLDSIKVLLKPQPRPRETTSQRTT